MMKKSIFSIFLTLALTGVLFVLSKQQPSLDKQYSAHQDFINLLFEKRNSYYQSWKTYIVGKDHWCNQRNFSALYKTSIEKISHLYENKLSDLAVNTKDQNLARFMAATFDFQNELSLLRWKKQNWANTLDALDANLGHSLIEKLIQDELLYINRNYPQRLAYNHEFSETVLSFHFNKNLRPDMNPLMNSINELKTSFNLLSELDIKQESLLSKVFNSTLDFGWNLSALYTYEMVHTQYCREL